MIAAEQLQRTAEWHKARQGRVTGSRLGAILGLSPWQKPDDVLRAMVREYHGAENEFTGNPATEFGTFHEREAMLAFMRATGLDVEEVGFLPLQDWLGASPDGLCSDGAVLEIKVPFSMRNKPETEFKPLAMQPHYFAQVQLEMLAAARQKAYFFQYAPAFGDVFGADYLPPRHVLETVDFDDAWWSEHEPKARAFFERYLTELDNPAHLEPLRVDLDSNPLAGQLLARMDELQETIASCKSEYEHHLKQLVEIAGGKDAIIQGRKLTLVKRKGAISYAKAVKDLLPDADFEPYRGADSESWRLS